MNDLVSRIQRQLPDTDKTRYDAAYERGRTQAHGGLLVGGLAFGALAGAALMFLFDPNRGADRRAQLATRATGLRNDLTRTANSRVEDLQGRAAGTTIEAGYRAPEEGVPAHATTRTTKPRARRTKASNGTPVASLPVDDDTPGATVADPIRPEEIERFGASGPIAGATMMDAGAQGSRDDWEAAERDAKETSEGHAAG